MSLLRRPGGSKSHESIRALVLGHLVAPARGSVLRFRRGPVEPLLRETATQAIVTQTEAVAQQTEAVSDSIKGSPHDRISGRMFHWIECS